MARHLRREDVEAVVALLDRWKDQVTWEGVCAACQGIIGITPARQTLAKNIEVKTAFDAAKKRIVEADQALAFPSSLRIAAERISRLEAEVERLQELTRRFQQRFVVWQYNAYARGMTDRDLDRELPSIDRNSTDRV